MAAAVAAEGPDKQAVWVVDSLVVLGSADSRLAEEEGQAMAGTLSSLVLVVLAAHSDNLVHYNGSHLDAMAEILVLVLVTHSGNLVHYSDPQLAAVAGTLSSPVLVVLAVYSGNLVHYNDPHPNAMAGNQVLVVLVAHSDNLVHYNGQHSAGHVD